MTVRESLFEIQNEIAAEFSCCKIRIIAVTKTVDEEKIIGAYQAGIRDFGESKIVEALAKIEKLPKEIKKTSRFHFIGHMQTNKVSKAVGKFDFIHSIDSLRVTQKVLLQLNNAGEEQKYGFSKEELRVAFKEMQRLKGIEIVGLMNIAPLKASKKELKKLFSEVTAMKRQLEKEFNCELKEIYME